MKRMKEFKINVSDALQIEKYENALEELRTVEQPTGKASEVLKAQCEIIRRFFDTCFGVGAGIEKFGDSYDYMVHYKALNELVTNANNDLNQLTQEMAYNATKYSADRASRK